MTNRTIKWFKDAVLQIAADYEVTLPKKVSFSKQRPSRQWSMLYGTCGVKSVDIKLHPMLIDSFIPDEVVLHVIHHELMHIKHPPIDGSGSKRIVHHKEFRKAERAFPLYKAAMAWMTRTGPMHGMRHNVPESMADGFYPRKVQAAREMV